MSEKQPLLNNENCKIDVYNYDSIPYSVVSSVSDVSDVNVINSDEIEDGCTPFQASFNTINLLGNY